jgi:Fur family peroxide stress response transcriptional regulator
MEGYKNKGFKLTPQRLMILGFLNGNKNHPSAEDIYREVLRIFPNMSLATVYNTLETLKKRGNIAELTIDSNKKRFDPNTEHHHHLICVKCKKIIDIHRDYKLPVSDKEVSGFEVIGNHIEFYGICRECKQR